MVSKRQILLTSSQGLKPESRSKMRRLTQVQGAFNELLERRSHQVQEIRRQRGRLDEIEELTKRFRLLDDHYQTDLKRLGAIYESGSLFVYLERTTCPLCGAAPGDQHLDDDCDGNTEGVVQAASAEMDKIHRLRRELSDTVASLEQERSIIGRQLVEFGAQYRETNRVLSQFAAPAVSAERASYNEIVTKSAEVKSGLEKFGRIERLVTQRAALGRRGS
jgi:DNA repair exonuclease SbcCD ATPase subunit